jgi:hypothetical protein
MTWSAEASVGCSSSSPLSSSSWSGGAGVDERDTAGVEGVEDVSLA